MTETLTAAEPKATEPRDDGATYNAFEETLKAAGPALALDRLIEQLDAAHEYRALLDALLLKARYELELPLIMTGSLSSLAEPARTHYEEKYVSAIRLVGSRHLDAGDIPTAWAYYRAIAETEPIASAIRDYQPSENDERLGAVIEVAFNHGVSLERGFELILEHYGTCPAITAFEQIPPNEEASRSACAGRLIRRVHRELTANLRSEIASRGQVLPPDGTSVAALVEDRPWLFSDESYHIDTSHLASVVRMSTLVHDPEVLKLAVDLTEYGRRLSPRLLFEGPPPFEKIFDDYRIYLRAFLGEDVAGAIAHFREKLTPRDDVEADPGAAAQVVVSLLDHAGRLDEAIDVASEYLAGIPSSAVACPGVAQLCLRAGQPQRLAGIAREQRDPVTFAAALLQTRAASPS
jgi:hypothetical protein